MASHAQKDDSRRGPLSNRSKKNMMLLRDDKTYRQMQRAMSKSGTIPYEERPWEVVVEPSEQASGRPAVLYASAMWLGHASASARWACVPASALDQTNSVKAP